MKIIGIAGGSGSGKSTISYLLVDRYPDKFEVINLDDYQKFKSESNLPMLNNKINWDHPDIIRWDNLLTDIKKLKSNISITIPVWAHRSNPNYFEHGKMKPRTIHPQPILLVEGYLALWYKPLRKLYSKSYYFELDEKARHKRRNKFIDPKYEQEIVKPMFKQFIQPTKQFATSIVNVSQYNAPDIATMIAHELL